MIWQEDAQVKLAPPKAVGLPKPPQILAKVRELVIEWKFGFIPVCSQEDQRKRMLMCWFHVMLANGINSTNTCHVGFLMALGYGKWGLPRNHKH